MNTFKRRHHRKLLGDYLLAAGFIDQKTLDKALETQRQRKRLGQIFLDMGVMDDVMLARALSQQCNIPFLKLDKLAVPPEVLRLVPAEDARRYQVLPVRLVEKRLTVVMVDPLDDEAVRDLRFITNCAIEAAVAPQKVLNLAINHFYNPIDVENQAPVGEFVAKAPQKVMFADENMEEEEAPPEEDEAHDLLTKTEQVPVVKYTNAILVEAIKRGASDIHIQPEQEGTIIRYRIDGLMHEIMRIQRNMHPPIVARIKVLSRMDISIRHKPQDGRCRLRYGGRKYDFRISSLPTHYGEKVTMRILDAEGAVLSLEDLGLSARNAGYINQSITRPTGIILVTGPTGSGKSTTLYAVLKKLNTPEVNIITVEDPVEYNMPGINQVHVNDKQGISFAAGLRSILRQDPDIVMVGEIRDQETAKTAIRAGQTGHLVLSTLHTNDAPSAVTRLTDMGIEPYLVAGSVISVTAQRLARKLCQKCKVKGSISQSTIDILHPLLDGHAATPVFLPRTGGCSECHNQGYRGRVGLHEVLMVNSRLRDEIARGVPTTTLRNLARSQNEFQEMIYDGVQKSLEGLTSFEEILRVTPPPELDEAATL